MVEAVAFCQIDEQRRAGIIKMEAVAAQLSLDSMIQRPSWDGPGKGKIRGKRSANYGFPCTPADINLTLPILKLLNGGEGMAT